MYQKLLFSLLIFTLLTAPDASAQRPYFSYHADKDSDGYGSQTVTQYRRNYPLKGNWVLGDSSDCNDSNALVYPTATELCNGIDDNCNGTLDEGGQTKLYADINGDGFGDDSTLYVLTCPNTQVFGYVPNMTTPLTATSTLVALNGALNSVSSLNTWTSNAPGTYHAYTKMMGDTVKSFHFASIYEGGGSTCTWAMTGTHDTVTHKGNGYNCFQPNPRTNCGNSPVDYFKMTWFSLVPPTKIPLSIVLNLHDDLSDTKWMTTTLHPAIVMCGSEWNLQANSDLFPLGGQSYVGTFNPYIDSVKEWAPGTLTSMCISPLWNQQNYGNDWNSYVIVEGHADALTTYWNRTDFDMMRINNNFLQNKIQIDSVISFEMPLWLAIFKAEVPTLKMIVYQYGLQNGFETDELSMTALGNCFIAREHAFFVTSSVDNPTLIPACYYMSLQALVNNNNTITSAGIAMQLVGKMYATGGTIVQVSTTLPDVYGIGSTNGALTTLVIINEGAAEVVLPTLGYDGKIIQASSVTSYASWGKSLSSTAISRQTYKKSIVIKPYSVTAIQF